MRAQSTNNTLESSKQDISKIDIQLATSNLFNSIKELDRQGIKELGDYTNYLGYNKQVIGILNHLINYIGEKNVKDDINNIIYKDEIELQLYLKNMSVDLAKSIWERHYKTRKCLFNVSDISVIEIPVIIDCNYMLSDILSSTKIIEFKKIICKEKPELITFIRDDTELIEIVNYLRDSSSYILDNITLLNKRLLIRTQEVLIENGVKINPIKKYISSSDIIQLYSLKNNYIDIRTYKNLSIKNAIELVKFDNRRFKDVYNYYAENIEMITEILKEFPRLILELDNIYYAKSIYWITAIRCDETLIKDLVSSHSDDTYSINDILITLLNDKSESLMMELSDINFLDRSEYCRVLLTKFLINNPDYIRHFKHLPQNTLYDIISSLKYSLKYMNHISIDIDMCVYALINDELNIDYIPERIKSEVLSRYNDIKRESNRQ